MVICNPIFYKSNNFNIVRFWIITSTNAICNIIFCYIYNIRTFFKKPFYKLFLSFDI